MIHFLYPNQDKQSGRINLCRDDQKHYLIFLKTIYGLVQSHQAL